MALGIPETSLAQALQRGASEDQNRAALDSSVAPGAEEGADLTLRLALFDTVGLDPAVTAATKERVEETFRQIDVAIEWFVPASVSDGTEADPGYYLKVMLFAAEPVRWGHPADAMGIVIGTQFPHDAVWMFDPVIRRALDGAKRRRRPLSSEELGRAYARVLAHEVVHALANDMRHAESGLMAPTQNRNALISRSIEIDEHSAAEAARGLRRCLELATTR